MPVFKDRSVLTGMKVREAMRKNVSRLPADSSLKACIRFMNRCRINAVLLGGPDPEVQGVVSKTDIMGAYYAGLPIDGPAGDIMNPPLFCDLDDPIEQTLALMEAASIHRVYVKSKGSQVTGTLSYSDIVGLLYRYCRTCLKSGRQDTKIKEKELPRLTVKDVMTRQVISCHDTDTIVQALELLSAVQTGAVAVVDKKNCPVGVISKTDLNRAYSHGAGLDDPVTGIMGAPVVTCGPDDFLVDAIQKMFLLDLQRLFAADKDTGQVLGVLSLSDAARSRSGTCKACSASRIVTSFDS